MSSPLRIPLSDADPTFDSQVIPKIDPAVEASGPKADGGGSRDVHRVRVLRDHFMKAHASQVATREANPQSRRTRSLLPFQPCQSPSSKSTCLHASGHA